MSMQGKFAGRIAFATDPPEERPRLAHANRIEFVIELTDGGRGLRGKHRTPCCFQDRMYSIAWGQDDQELEGTFRRRGVRRLPGTERREA